MRISFTTARRLFCLALVAAIVDNATAQVSVPKVSVSSVVDTTSSDAASIARLVRTYLSQTTLRTPPPGLWSAVDGLDRRAGDVNRFYVYQGYPATIVALMPATAGDSLYLIKVLHASTENSSQRVEPWALQRLYAVRAPDAPYGWQLSNALSRITRDWPAHTVGRIRFHYAAGQRPVPERAATASRFVDSVATLFSVRAPEYIDYYVTASPEEYWRAMGLDFLMLPSTARTGGNAIPEAAIVLAGDPSQGEAYLHEVAHAVLGRGFGGAILAEGIPTWLAGSRGRSTRQMYQLLVDYLRSHPQITLAALLGVEGYMGVNDTDARYATGALFIEGLFRRGGITALRTLAATPSDPPAFLADMRSRLGLSASDAAALDRWWRQTAEVFAKTP